jgi:hypothetical protein
VRENGRWRRHDGDGKLTINIPSMDNGIFIFNRLDHASDQHLRPRRRIVHSNEPVRPEWIIRGRHVLMPDNSKNSWLFCSKVL